MKRSMILAAVLAILAFSPAGAFAQLNCSGGCGTANLTATYVGFGDSTKALTGESNFTWNSTTHALSIYNQLTFGSSGDNEVITITGNGTLAFSLNGGSRWRFGDSVSSYSLQPTTDNASDLCAASSRCRTGYFGGVTVNAGAGTSTMLTSGMLNTQVSAAGIGNPASTAETTLFTYSIQTNGFSTNGKMSRTAILLESSAAAATATANLYVGSLTFAGIPPSTDAAVKVIVYLYVQRVDSTHVHVWYEADGGTTGLISDFLTNQAVSDLTANPLQIRVTASSSTSTANSIKAYNMITEFLN